MNEHDLVDAQGDKRLSHKSIRLWPGVVVVCLQMLAIYVLPLVVPDSLIFTVLCGLVGSVLIVLWWMFFSRAFWPDRLLALLAVTIGLLLTPRILHESILTGAMGMLFYIYATPYISLAFVLAVVISRGLSNTPRRVTLVLSILMASSAWGLVRTGGFTASGDNDFAWRWSATPEDRLLAQLADEQLIPREVPSDGMLGASWPGFRGPDRSGVVSGVSIESDWVASPPVELWRRPVGPSWSSFAVSGGFIFTQEQLGEEEVVSCYMIKTGEPVWRHRDSVRFYESNAGAGPRGTPTLHEGRIYSLGGTGILNALDARSGTVVWSKNVASDVGREIPDWGFAGSPLVADDVVYVAAAGRLVAYELDSGKLLWFGPDHGGYSSPHLLTIDGVQQVLLLSGSGITSFDPANGTVLWEHEGGSIVQPVLTADGDILIGVVGESGGAGISRIAVKQDSDRWTTTERWKSNRLKPYFNDFVIHEGHAYGFDGSILTCLDIADGARKWKGGRYGNGQLILLAEQGLLLVLSEQGDLALVSADSNQFREQARIPAIQGKTWNHPVLVGDILLVRNAQEMVAYRLVLTDR